jgi:hypothetical protein
MRALTNDYRDCKIIKIDPADPTSPYGVMQEGYDPNDPTYRTRMFYLQRDGQWIDEVTRSTRPDSEGGDVLFETSADALELLGRLRGKPVVRDLPVSKDDVKNYLARVGSGSSPQELLRQFLARYRAAKGKPSHIEKPQLAAPMPENSSKLSSKRVLEPIDRVAEVLFGLIMVLTFTGSLSVAEAGRDDVRAMLIGALGCNLAWGIIDGVLYLMGCLAEKGRGLLTFRAVRKATDPKEAHRLIADALPSVVATVLKPAELEAVHERLKQLPEPPERARLRKDDWLGAVGVFLLVFLCTFPVVIPFIFMRHAGPALRVSNAVAIVMLFLTGYAFGRMTGRHPWLFGVSMVVLGLILVGMTMALGG